MGQITMIQFLFVVKAPNLKQQIPEFYPQILSTAAIYYIYLGQQPVINVKPSICD